MRHPSPRHSDMAVSWWVVVVALSATHDLLALPTHLPAPGPAEDRGEDDGDEEEEGDDDVHRRRRREMIMYTGGGGGR